MRTDLCLSLSNTTLYPAAILSKTKITAMTSIQANVEEIEEKRKPVSIIAVVDSSGSMTGSKIQQVSKTLKMLILELTKDDTFGLITYSSDVKVLQRPKLMTNEEKINVIELIDSIQCNGATNLSGGLFTALRLHKSENKVSSILLMTDGHANQGLIESKAINNQIYQLQNQGYGKGLIINTFGFGLDHNASMLKEISDSGEGMYYFIENSNSIPSAIADCVGGLFSSIAQNIELTIEAIGKNEINEIQIDKSIRKTDEIVSKKKFRISFSDIQAGESRDIPFICSLCVCDEDNEFPFVKITLSYYDIQKECLEEISKNICIKRQKELLDDDLQMNIKVNTQCNRYLAAEANKRAISLADSGKFKEATDEISSAINQISTSNSANEELCLGFVGELNNSNLHLRSKKSYQTVGQKEMFMSAKTFHCQRSTNHCDKQRRAYFETPARKCMKERFNSSISHHS